MKKKNSPGRTYNGNGYKYGLNGMLKDDEIAGSGKRDAQGNVMATYEENDPIASGVATTFAIKEQHLYDSSRIGVKTTNFDPSTAPAFTDTYTCSRAHSITKLQ